MAKNDVRNSIKLTSVDELFSTEESRADSQREKVLEIPLSEISDFPNHPFKVKADEAMLEMADSVKQYGVLVPGLAKGKKQRDVLFASIVQALKTMFLFNPVTRAMVCKSCVIPLAGR